jgi:DNA primase small subunit
MKKIDTVTWVCEGCLETAKREIFKLIDDFIVPDFGVSLGEIEICFSGHRGYHLHIVSEGVRGLTGDGRREIADYVRGIGLDPKEHGFRQVTGHRPDSRPRHEGRGMEGEDREGDL